jgi:hypothetical protein
MQEIERGTAVLAACADGKTRELRALTGVVAGGDFAVVWACSQRRWDAAEAGGEEPEGIPWPAEDVRVGPPATAAIRRGKGDDPNVRSADG